MFRKGINRALLVLLVFAVISISTSCGKLSVDNLKANHHFTSANQHFTDGVYRRAIEEYELALGYNPSLIEAYRFLGESYKSLYKPGVEDEENAERASKALEALLKAREIDPNNRDIIYSLGDMYDKLRNFDEAEKLYLNIIEMDPTEMSNYYVVAEFYKRFAGGSEEEEGEEGEEGTKEEGKTPFEKAEEMYLRRIETDPESPQGYAYISQFYDNLTPIPDWDKAVLFHDKRIALNPEDAESWLSKGVNRWSKAYRLAPRLNRQQRIVLARESEAALMKAMELDATYPEPYSWLSVLYKSVMVKLYPERAKRYEEDADRYIEQFQESRKRRAERKKLEEELKKTTH